MKYKLLLSTLTILAVFLGACSSEDRASNDAQVASDFGTNTNASYTFGQQIEDNEQYSLTLVEASKTSDNDYQSMEINFDFENKTDAMLTLSADSLSMDGKMVDFMTYFFYEEVSAGNTASISLDVAEFEDYEYPEFNKDFEVEIMISDADGEEIGKHTVVGEIK